MNALKRLAGMLVQEERAIPVVRLSWFNRYFLEPSVAQAPLPLHSFLPNCFLLPPPLPLQEFSPLQACFSISFLSVSSAKFPASAENVGLDTPCEGAAFNRAIVPPSRPAKAAVSTREFLLIFMWINLLLSCRFQP